MWLQITKMGLRIQYFDFWSIKYRSDVGFGTSVNKQYMKDKNLVFDSIIKKSKNELGFCWYILAKISFKIYNSIAIRSIYGFLFR